MPRRPSPAFRQLEMTFELPPRSPQFEAGSLDVALQLRATLSEALRESTQSRHQVAARMSELTGADISKTMLDSWTAESKEAHRFPVEYLVAFEVATGSTLLTELIAQKRGYEPLFGEAAVYARIAQLEHEADRIAAERDSLRRIARAGRR
jgi:hypothetical protein